MNLNRAGIDIGLGPVVCEQLVQTLGCLQLRSRDHKAVESVSDERSLHAGAAIDEILQTCQWIDELVHLATLSIVAGKIQVDISDLIRIQSELFCQVNKVLGAREFNRIQLAREWTNQGRDLNSWMGQH